MPKETFFNLQEEKRTSITNIAIEEFGNHDYGDVSISRIVARAGIAKGSFYQYFENKEDLYSYLLDLCMQKKWEFMGLDHPDPQHVGVFQYMRWTIEAGLQMQVAYPELVKVAYRAHRSSAYPEEFFAHAKQESHKFFLHLVAIGKEQGDIAPEIDDDLAAFIFTTVTVSLGQYMLQRSTESGDYEPGKKDFFPPEVMVIFEQTLNILEHGMGKSYPLQASENYLKEMEVSR